MDALDIYLWLLLAPVIVVAVFAFAYIALVVLSFLLTIMVPGVIICAFLMTVAKLFGQ